MPTVEEEYDKRYGKAARSKRKPKGSTPLDVVNLPKPTKGKKKKKKTTGVIESIKGIAKGLMKKTKERTGSESMYEKHEKRRKKK
jgi:hypothetical protein